VNLTPRQPGNRDDRRTARSVATRPHRAEARIGTTLAHRTGPVAEDAPADGIYAM
jgi:hypothetical protein